MGFGHSKVKLSEIDMDGDGIITRKEVVTFVQGGLMRSYRTLLSPPIAGPPPHLHRGSDKTEYERQAAVCDGGMNHQACGGVASLGLYLAEGLWRRSLRHPGPAGYAVVVRCVDLGVQTASMVRP